MNRSNEPTQQAQPSQHQPRPIIILGPTAGGKSELAVRLAEQLPGYGEVIGADSMQIYKHMDAGTAKPTPAMRERVPHHGIDIVEPTEPFNVADWLTLAHQKIAACLAPPPRGRGQGEGERQQDKSTDKSSFDQSDDGELPSPQPSPKGRGRKTHEPRWPVIVGGTNLYLKALREGLYDAPGQDAAFRATLDNVSDADLHEQLKQKDPLAAERIHPNDRRRILRALEVQHLTGKRQSEQQTQWQDLHIPSDRPAPSKIENQKSKIDQALLIGLRWPAEAINPRINLRVKAMFYPEKVDPELAAEVCIGGESLIEETQRLEAENKLGLQAREALGYKQVLAAMNGKMTMDEAFEQTKIQTRRFAKQQRTWLKRFRDVHWIDAVEHDDDARLNIALDAIHNDRK